MIHSKKVKDCDQFQQIIYKYLKLVQLELESQTASQPILVIPLDFLTLLNIQNQSSSNTPNQPSYDASTQASGQENENEHLSDIISSIVLTLKQFLYSRSQEDMQDNNLQETQELSGQNEQETLIVFTMSKSKGAKQNEHKKEVSRLVQKYIQHYMC